MICLCSSHAPASAVLSTANISALEQRQRSLWVQLTLLLARLVPRPRQHEIVYCGLFAANAKEQQPRSSAWRRIANERKLHPKHDASAPSSTICWAELLRRTFSHDLLRWQRCSSAAVGEQRGRARVIAAITQRHVIDKILNHTGLGRPCANPASPRSRQPASPLDGESLVRRGALE